MTLIKQILVILDIRMDKVSSLSIALHIRIIVKELLNEVRKLYLINTNLINQINKYIYQKGQVIIINHLCKGSCRGTVQ